MFMIRVAMGAVNFKIVPEASVFRGDAYYDGPGAQKYIFWRKKAFLDNVFQKYFLEENIFRDIFLQTKTQKIFVGKIGLGGNFGFGGSGPENYSPDLPPDF